MAGAGDRSHKLLVTRHPADILRRGTSRGREEARVFDRRIAGPDHLDYALVPPVVAEFLGEAEAIDPAFDQLSEPHRHPIRPSVDQQSGRRLPRRCRQLLVMGLDGKAHDILSADLH